MHPDVRYRGAQLQQDPDSGDLWDANGPASSKCACGHCLYACFLRRKRQSSRRDAAAKRRSDAARAATTRAGLQMRCKRGLSFVVTLYLIVTPLLRESGLVPPWLSRAALLLVRSVCRSIPRADEFQSVNGGP